MLPRQSDEVTAILPEQIVDYEIFDLDDGDVVGTFIDEEEAVATYEIACMAHPDYYRRLVVYEVDGTGHVKRTMRGPNT